MDSQRFDQIGDETATVLETTRQMVGLTGWENSGGQAIPDASFTRDNLSVGTSTQTGNECVNWGTGLLVRGDINSVAIQREVKEYWESLGLSVGYINDDQDTGEFYMVGRGSGDNILNGIGLMLVKMNSGLPKIGIDIESICIPGDIGVVNSSLAASRQASQ